MFHDTMRWAEASHEHSLAPTIKNHSVTHFNGYLYCFGGYDGRKNHMTLLLYSIAEQRWIRPHHHNSPVSGNNANNMMGSSNDMHMGDGGHHNGNNNVNGNQDYMQPGDPSIVVQGTPPPGRNGHSATLAADDDETAKIVIIGGWLGTGPYAASDTHILDIAPNNQLRWYQPAVKGSPPGPCNMHSADYVPHRREVYTFRGGNGREYLNDLHALNVDTLVWRRVITNGKAPQPRANHSSAMLEHELCLFGGWNGAARLNDIHILDTITSTWTCPRVGGVLPHPRAGMTLTAMRGRLLLFGGSGTSAKCFNDLQILDRHEMVWLDVSQGNDTDSETGNNKNSSAGNSSNNNNALFDMEEGPSFRFGGDDFHNRQQHDWLTAGVRTMHVSPNPNDEDSVPTVLIHGRGPGRRAGHTATAVHRKVYVFGGSCGADYLNDFFVLDTDPRPRMIVSEPNSLTLLERRLGHFFNDPEFSDVTFLVQGQRVYGHKMILSIVSDCFRAMFTTGFKEESANEIEIRDCSYSAFLAMMEYVYTGTVAWKNPPTTSSVASLAASTVASLPSSSSSSTSVSHQQHDAWVDRIVELLELADRFFLDNLKQNCEQRLQALVTADTVEYMLQVAQKTNAIQLQMICEHFVRNRNEPVSAS